jgi:hypothetical protein
MKRAGRLSDAMATYQEAAEVVDADADVDFDDYDTLRNNIAILKEEMQEWTGASGRLTPGC